MLAVVAKRHGVKFMVVAPSGTFDAQCPDGAHIPIEERTAKELTEFREHGIAPVDYDAYNPVFDVTPAELIDVIVCERGVIQHPTREKVLACLGSAA
jgi:methylthioribose-1-phosphate isomerase